MSMERWHWMGLMPLRQPGIVVAEPSSARISEIPLLTSPFATTLAPLDFRSCPTPAGASSRLATSPPSLAFGLHFGRGVADGLSCGISFKIRVEFARRGQEQTPGFPAQSAAR